MKHMIPLVVLLLNFFNIDPVAAIETKPNILFILADDLGWGDVGFHQGIVPTPHLDRLATESVELTQHYVNPMCSPTRAALLSGRYASRFNVTTAQNTRAYRWNTLTLAGALKAADYETALCGKWHLGSKSEWGPQKFGFDHSYGSLAGGAGPWNHLYKRGEYTVTWHRNGELIEEKGHITDLITREAVRRLEARTAKPLFLYVPFTAVHTPMREPEEILRRVPQAITEPSRRQFAASLLHLDDSIGLILAALEKTGAAANTLVIFSSDNGATPDVENNGPQYPPDGYDPGPAGGCNAPWRGNKGQVYEGGIRTPTLVRLPGQLQPGKFSGAVHVSDWMPTLCALAGHTPTEDLHWDGVNLWPQLTGKQPPTPRTIYIAGPGYRSRVLRDGDWKLIVTQDPSGQNSTAGTEGIELYNLAVDPGEAKNLAAEQPEIVSRLRRKLSEASKADRDAVADD